MNDSETNINQLARIRMDLKKLKAELAIRYLRIEKLERQLQSCAMEVAEEVLGINGESPEHIHYHGE